MDFGYDQEMGNERLTAYERDADRARELGWWHEPSPRAVRDASRIGGLVRRAISATARCRWDEVERTVSRLEHDELRPAAGIAVKAIYAQARGDTDTAEDLCRRLVQVPIATHADSHVWAAGVIAAALHGYLRGTVDDTAQPVGLVRQMCARSDALHPETSEFMCLSLALLARAGQSPVLASFLLGHLTDALGGIPAGGRPSATWTSARDDAAARATAGLCILAMGDARTGARLLLELAESNHAAQMPLVAGLVGVELARIELQGGSRQAASHWIERTNRFSRRYGTRMPLQVLTRMKAGLPGGDD